LFLLQSRFDVDTYELRAKARVQRWRRNQDQASCAAAAAVRADQGRGPGETERYLLITPDAGCENQRDLVIVGLQYTHGRRRYAKTDEMACGAGKRLWKKKVRRVGVVNYQAGASSGDRQFASPSAARQVNLKKRTPRTRSSRPKAP
jgi:hypothetical protein